MALGGALGCGLGAWRRGILRGRRGTTLHPPSFHVAGVAQTRIYLRFPWQAWHSCHWVARLGVVWARVTPRHFAWQAWHNLTSTFVSGGRRGTNSHLPSFSVAGVALMALGGALGCGLGARDAAPFCVAGVAQPYIHLRFTWQAWHKLASTFVFRGRQGTWVWFGRAWRRGILRGRRGTTLHPPSFHVAGVAQTRIYLGFAWQAWHSWHWVARLGVVWAPWRRAILRGRRGTTLHPPSFHVAGVTQTCIYLRFPWQTWHSWHWVARLGVVWARVTPRHFAWQAWRNLTSTFVSRGRRGTNSHLPSLSVAGVALMALGGALGCGLGARDAAPFCVASVEQPYIHPRFTWQAWHKLASTFVFRGRRGTHGIGWRAWVWFGRACLVRICRPWRCGSLRGRPWRCGSLRGRRGIGLLLTSPALHINACFMCKYVYCLPSCVSYLFWYQIHVTFASMFT